MEAREHTQANLQLLREQLDSGGMRSARLMIHALHPAEVARLLESMPLRERAVLWEMVDPDDEGDVLVEVSDEVRDGLISTGRPDQRYGNRATHRSRRGYGTRRPGRSAH